MRFFLLYIVFQIVISFNAQTQSAIYLKNNINIKIGPSASLNIQGDLKIEDNSIGDTARISNEGNILIKGDWLNLGKGVLQDDSPGKVTFNGGTAQNIEGSTNFYSLDINNDQGVSIKSGINGIHRQLDLTGGNLSTNDSLTLFSTASKTARIATILNGSISGEVIIQCFIENVGYDYRFLSMPVQGGSLSQWNDDVLLTGFIGTPFPNFSFNNVYTYNELLPGDLNIGYLPAINITDNVAMGQGVQVYAGNSDLLIDVKGDIYSGTQSLPVSFTDDPLVDNSHDGWNLIGNPYPSTIDWDSPDWIKTNIEDAIYIYQGSIGAYQSYVAGVGTNGGSRYIPSSQAFWVKASGAPTLEIKETVKADVDAGFIERITPPDILRLSLSANSKKDEVVVRYNRQASAKFDKAWDAIKFKKNTQQLSLTLIQDSIQYSILSDHEDSMTVSPDIYLKAEVPLSGVYTLHVDQLPSNANCLYLEDLRTGRVENLRDSVQFHFNLSDTTTVAQFRLNTSPVVFYELKEALCSNDSVSVIAESALPNGVNLTWTNSGGQQGTTYNLNNDTVKLAEGTYFFESSKPGCSTQKDTFRLTVPSPILLSIDSLLDTSTGLHTIWVDLVGGIPPYRFTWSGVRAGHSDSLFQVGNGLHSVLVTDANQCSDSAALLINRISVGTEEVKVSGLSVFPNPVKDVFTLKNSGLNSLKYQLYNIKGQLLIEGFSREKETKISTNGFSPGLYFLKIISGRKSEVIQLKKL